MCSPTRIHQKGHDVPAGESSLGGESGGRQGSARRGGRRPAAGEAEAISRLSSSSPSVHGSPTPPRLRPPQLLLRGPRLQAERPLRPGAAAPFRHTMARLGWGRVLNLVKPLHATGRINLHQGKGEKTRMEGRGSSTYVLHVYLLS
uniref:Uncharacterized protein n=1 Tax=Oryza punctata TaxID=4537 RepID=A0A0E0JRZ4_ORYPU